MIAALTDEKFGRFCFPAAKAVSYVRNYGCAPTFRGLNSNGVGCNLDEAPLKLDSTDVDGVLVELSCKLN